jgi:multidrug efflux pump subunit AcrA (membrane-fusion protein)
MAHWIRRKKLYLIAAAVLLVATGAVRLRRSVPEVGVAEVSRGPLRLQIAASGLVEAEAADLGFKTAGRIERLYVEEGDTVGETDLLARISPVDAYASAGGASDVIQAPYDAHVVEIYQRAGAVVQPGQAVLRVVAARTPWVTAFIESEDAAHLKPGDPLRCRAGGYLSVPWDLVVRHVGQEAVSRRDLPGSSRQVRVRAEVVSAGFALRPGTEVDIDGDVLLVSDGLLIPTDAVIHGGTRDGVWVLEGGTARRRDVKLGPNNFDLIHIREGLRAGEVVVVDGKDGLREGQRVRARPMRPMETPAGGGAEP